MKSVWVNRDGSNKIAGVFGIAQFKGQEKLLDTDQEVLDYRNAQTSKKQQDEQDKLDATARIKLKFSLTDAEFDDLRKAMR